MLCPKCQYKRKSTDDAPLWQCPSCKVAYAKVTQANQTKPAQVERTKRWNNDVEDAEEFNMFELIFVIFAVIAIIPWTMYCMNTLLPAMDIGQVKIKALVLLAIAPPAILIGLFFKLRPLRGGELSKVRKITFLIAVLIIWGIIKFFNLAGEDASKRTQEYWDSQTELIEKTCHGGQLNNDALDEAVEMGYKINSTLRCIKRESYAKVQADIKLSEAKNAKDKAEYEKERLAAEAKYKENQELSQAKQANQSQIAGENTQSENATNQQQKLLNGMFYRCIAPDRKSYSYIRRSPCPTGDVQTIEEAIKPIMPRSPSNQTPIRCTSKEGNVSIQMGNCASPDDYQQAL